MKEGSNGEQQPKPVKIPGAFKKPIKKRKFVARYEKLIEHPEDRKFFVSCFEEQEEFFSVRQNLSKENIKRLKSLYKVIKSNRKGDVRIVPILFASAIVAAIVFFFTIFANPLLERAMEMGLEAAFEAKSDVDNFRLSLIRFEISMSGVTVANRDSPMTNLFQLGRTEIILRPQAILRGKIYIESIRAQTIRFGTPRTVSGYIGIPPRTAAQRAPKPPAPPLIDLQNFDAMGLLNQEFERLRTPKLYDIAINAYNETSTKWRNQVETTTANVQNVRASAAPLINLNTSNLRDPAVIASTARDIEAAISSVQTAANDVNRIISGLEADINMARDLESTARSSITDDLNLLKSYIDLGSGEAFRAIEPFIREILSDSAQMYINYGLMALDALGSIQRLASNIPKSEKPKKAERFKGRTVHYPTVTYPAFYLGVMASDFTIDSWNWSFDLRDVTSHPNWISRPVTLKLGMTETAGSLRRNVAFDGSANFRSDASQLFSADVRGSGFPVNLETELGNIGINGFRGQTDFSVNASGFPGGGFSAGGNVAITEASVTNPNGTLAQAIDTAVRETDRVNLGIQFSNNDFSLTTNIGDLILLAIRRTAEAYARNAIADLERALRQKIDEYIDGRFDSRETIDALLRTARGDRTVIDQTRNALNAKLNELNQRVQQAVQENVQAVQQAGQQAIDDATRQAEEAARQAREEAERRAREEAERAGRDALRRLF
ncbi:MAG: hypothetical protein FWC01_01760 [Treponema sp.]|nr:hypothetical protein [Treponema sp.]MCL2236838.1 hypothetical protein [Treponema sp.]